MMRKFTVTNPTNWALFLSFLFMTPGMAQSDEAAAWLHFDKSFYVTGETIWFKVYLPVHLHGKGSLLKCSLYNTRGSRQTSFFLNPESNSIVPGYFQVPFDWSTGWYSMVISATSKENDEPLTLLKAELPIFSDFKTQLPQSGTAEDVHSEKQEGPSPEFAYQVELEFPKTVSVGSDVTVTFLIQDQNGQPVEGSLSAVVRDQYLTGPDIWDGTNIFRGPAIPKELEYHSHPIVKGALFDQEGFPYITNFFGAYEHTKRQFYYDIAYKLNLFVLHMPLGVGPRDIQMLDHLENTLEVQVLVEEGPGPIHKEPLYLNSGLETYLALSAERKSINRLFKQLGGPAIDGSTTANMPLWMPDRRFVMRAYERFEDLSSFFREISTPLKFQAQKSGKVKIRMFNPEMGMRSFYPGTPLFIIDGKLTRNETFLANLDIDLIDTLDLFYDFDKLQTTFGLLGYNGVVRIQTFGKSMQVPEGDPYYEMTIPGLQASVPQFQTSSPPSHIPALNPIVYWNAALNTEGRGGGSFQFRQGQNPGTYEIEVFFQDTKGNFGYGQSSYQAIPVNSP